MFTMLSLQYVIIVHQGIIEAQVGKFYAYEGLSVARVWNITRTKISRFTVQTFPYHDAIETSVKCASSEFLSFLRNYSSDPVKITSFAPLSAEKTQNNEPFAFVGGTSTFLCCASGYPLPIIKINNKAATEVNRTLQGTYLRCVKATIRNSGFRGRYQRVTCSAHLSNVSCINGPKITEEYNACVKASSSTDSNTTSILIAGTWRFRSVWDGYSVQMCLAF